MRILKVGDIVAFSSKWLKSTQAHELGRARGEVVAVASYEGLILVQVKWQDGRITGALHQNLVPVDRKHLESA